MGSPRFYLAGTITAGQEVVLSDVAGHHAARVLRLKPNDNVVLFNGDGAEYQGQLKEINKRTVTVSVNLKTKVQRESPLDITLIQAITSGEKMDFTIQKAVELGISHIVPIICERCVVRLDYERKQKRHQHWQNVVISACEQSGRNLLPEVRRPQTISDLFLTENWNNSLCLLLNPDAKESLADQGGNPNSVQILIGPEGGFNATETKLALDNGFKPVSLGPRVLRTETAALAALAAMQALWGDF